MYPIYSTPGFAPQAPSNNDDFSGMMGNPLLQIGLGILANNSGNYGLLGPALSKGFSQGLQNVQQAKYLQNLQQLQDMQMDDYQRQKTGEQALSKAIAGATTPASSPT